MDSEAHQLEMFVLPFLAPGHMIPMVDIARLFARRGVKVTIITTPANALLFQTAVDHDIHSGHHIQLHILPFPSVDFGLPQGCENFNSITSPDMAPKLFQAISMLQQPIEQLLRQRRPNCLVSDMFFPWTTDLAAQLGIPRLVFHGTSFFSLSLMDTIKSHAPHETVSSDTETFMLPDLPNQIEMTRLQLPDYVRSRKPYSFFVDQMREAELRSYGVVVNSFYELEPAYAEHYQKTMGRKAWHVGPVSLCVNRGENAVINEHNCLSWLDSKKPKSVLYVSFGSLSRFPGAQLIEIASGLEACGHPFIWVVRKREKSEEEEERWLPEGFEERMMECNKGLIIRGWAPQVVILKHSAIGGFVTHCGWNSILESVAACVPLIAWPLYAEQFYNEKLVTQVLRIGIGVGVEEWNSLTEEGKVPVKREKIEKVVNCLMDGGDEAEEIRKRVKEVGEMATRAVEEGGSSYSSLTALIEELIIICSVGSKTF